MDKEILEILDAVRQRGKEIIDLAEDRHTDIGYLSQKILAIAMVIEGMEDIIPISVYKQYSEFFTALITFCKQCGNMEFLLKNMDNILSSLKLFEECAEELEYSYREKIRICPCCGHKVVYSPMPDYYDKMNEQYSDDIARDRGVVSKEETLNKEEYICPNCGASDRDRLIISFLEKEGLQKASENFKVLQIAPSRAISKWIASNCPHIKYETTDLYMDQVSFQSDIMNMNMVSEETYDVIICSHVLEHVKDDRKALSEMKRILKPEGEIVFLVPVSPHISDIDEEWGLTEAENWRRFGQGDHCRRYGKQGMIQRLEEQFCVHSLGIDFFGQDVFKQCGLTDTSTLYILTKSSSVQLNMMEKIVVNERLCREGPLVSVLLPCYNHEMFVADAIESVINQSYKNIEILVADDASTDNTAAIIKKYSSYFTKEFYFTENIGGREDILTQNAKGEYIALMHSDDVWERDKLALQVEYMEKHEECGICFTWAVYTDENLNNFPGTIFFKANRNSHEWMRFFWEKGNVLCNPSSLRRRNVNTYLNSKKSASRQLPDFFRWVDVVQNMSIHIIPKVLVRMRRYQKKGLENVSIGTRENLLRIKVEEGCAWLGVIRDMEGDFFKNAFGSLMRDPNAESEEAIKCEKYFLLLGSPNPFVQNSAMCYFYEIFNDIKGCLEKEYHYTKKDFAEDMLKKGIVPLLGRKNDLDGEEVWKRQGADRVM